MAKLATVQAFADWLKDHGAPAVVSKLVLKYPQVVQPYLPALRARMPDMAANLADMARSGGVLQMPRMPVGASRRGYGGQMRSGKLDAFEAPSARYEGGGRVVYDEGGIAAWEKGREAARPLTDREAWTELAGLVDSALSSEPEALREALKAAFLDEARKAA